MNSLEKLSRLKWMLWIPFIGASCFLFMLMLFNKKNRININCFLFINGIRTFFEMLGFAIILVLLFKQENIILIEVLFFIWANILLVLMSLRLLKKTQQVIDSKQESDEECKY